MKITLKIIVKLINEVIFYYKNKYLKNYITDFNSDLRHKILLTKFLVMFFDEDKTRLENNFLALLDFYNELQIPRREVKFALANLFIFYKKWVKDYLNIKEEYYERVVHIYKNIFNHYQFLNEQSLQEDEFFVFDGEEVDDFIEEMHYDDSEKIDAKTFFEFNEISEEEIADVLESCDELDYIMDNALDLDENVVSHFSNVLNYLARILHITQEFADVGYAFDSLAKELLSIDFQDFDEKKRAIAFEILKQMNLDIRKWVEEVFINKTAQDIHYFDASFFANISQFKLILGIKE
jgi:integrase